MCVCIFSPTDEQLFMAVAFVKIKCIFHVNTILLIVGQTVNGILMEGQGLGQRRQKHVRFMGNCRRRGRFR